jgi:hypothetical protein
MTRKDQCHEYVSKLDKVFSVDLEKAEGEREVRS